MITHDDLKQEQIDPIDLSEALTKMCPIEYIASFGYFSIGIISGAPYWVQLITTPILVYNLSRVAAKDHKHYFITEHEYKSKFNRINF